MVKIVTEFKDSFDAAMTFARADEVVVSALAKYELQRTNNHRFAGSSLAGDADETTTQFPGEIIDECEVLDF